MQVCHRCDKSTRSIATVRLDKNTNKKWLVTSCMKCGFNFDLSEFENEIKSVTELDNGTSSYWKPDSKWFS